MPRLFGSSVEFLINVLSTLACPLSNLKSSGRSILVYVTFTTATKFLITTFKLSLLSSNMLLYHRPVPAKIPKRRSRAGELLLSRCLLRAVLDRGENMD